MGRGWWGTLGLGARDGGGMGLGGAGRVKVPPSSFCPRQYEQAHVRLRNDCFPNLPFLPRPRAGQACLHLLLLLPAALTYPPISAFSPLLIFLTVCSSFLIFFFVPFLFYIPHTPSSFLLFSSSLLPLCMFIFSSLFLCSFPLIPLLFSFIRHTSLVFPFSPLLLLFLFIFLIFSFIPFLLFLSFSLFYSSHFLLSPLFYPSPLIPLFLSPLFLYASPFIPLLFSPLAFTHSLIFFCLLFHSSFLSSVSCFSLFREFFKIYIFFFVVVVAENVAN